MWAKSVHPWSILCSRAAVKINCWFHAAMPLVLTKVPTPYPWWKLHFDGSAWVDYVRPNGNVELWAVDYFTSGWSEWFLSCACDMIGILFGYPQMFSILPPQGMFTSQPWIIPRKTPEEKSYEWVWMTRDNRVEHLNRVKAERGYPVPWNLGMRKPQWMMCEKRKKHLQAAAWRQSKSCVYESNHLYKSWLMYSWLMCMHVMLRPWKPPWSCHVQALKASALTPMFFQWAWGKGSMHGHE